KYLCTRTRKRPADDPPSCTGRFRFMRISRPRIVGGVMTNARWWLAVGLMSSFTLPAMAQSFRVQCPGSTITHPVAANNNAEPTFVGTTYVNATEVYPTKADRVSGDIKCQQIGGVDGYATMRDGPQTYLFSFGPLSGLAD